MQMVSTVTEKDSTSLHTFMLTIKDKYIAHSQQLRNVNRHQQTKSTISPHV